MIEEDILSLLTHEYLLVVYGVVAWELFLGVKGQKGAHTIRGMGFGGAIVAFDDEFLARFNDFAMIDFDYWPWYLYVTAGFALNLVISKYFFKDKENEAS